MVMNENRTFKIGELLVIETDQYSEFNWHGPVRILREFSTHDVAADFRTKVPKGLFGKYDSNEFLPWLIREGYAEEVACNTWHVGNHVDFEA